MRAVFGVLIAVIAIILGAAIAGWTLGPPMALVGVPLSIFVGCLAGSYVGKTGWSGVIAGVLCELMQLGFIYDVTRKTHFHDLIWWRIVIALLFNIAACWAGIWVARRLRLPTDDGLEELQSAFE